MEHKQMILTILIGFLVLLTLISGILGVFFLLFTVDASATDSIVALQPINISTSADIINYSFDGNSFVQDEDCI